MSNLFHYLQENQILSGADAYERLKYVNAREFKKLVDSCYHAANDSDIAPAEQHGIFDFSVTSHLSGGVHGCSELSCRLDRAYRLSLFASLYADKILIQNPFIHYFHSDLTSFTPEQLNNAKGQLLGDLSVLFLLKPLYESGILLVNPSSMQLCRNCSKRLHADEDAVQQALDSKKDRVISKLASTIIVTVADDKKSLTLSGPEDYFNAHVIGFIHLPSHLRKFFGHPRYKFSSKEIIDLKLLEPALFPILDDIFYHEVSPFSRGLIYLTDRTLDLEFIGVKDEIGNNSGAETSEMFSAVQQIPFVEGVSLEEIIAFRTNNEKHFLVFREALRKLLAKLKSGEIKTSDISQNINYELNKIDLVLKANRNFFTKKAVSKVIYSAATGILGHYTRVISPEILAALGSYQAKEVYDDAVTAINKPREVLGSDYYFLWKMQRKYK